MKKALAMLLVVMMMLSLAACGGAPASSSPDSSSDVAQSEESGSDEADETEEVEEIEEEPTAADVYVWIAENDASMEYSVPENSIAFIEEYPEFFPGSDKNTGAMSDHVDYEADYQHIAKNSAKYADSLTYVSGTIIDCKETETEKGTITYLQIMDEYSGYSYCLYYLGVLEEAFQDYSAWGYALPFGMTVFENIGGYYTEAVVGAACYVEVYDYYEDGYGGI